MSARPVSRVMIVHQLAITPHRPCYDVVTCVHSDRCPNISCVAAGIAVRSLMQTAKFLFHDQSCARPDEGEKACAHLSLHQY